MSPVAIPGGGSLSRSRAEFFAANGNIMSALAESQGDLRVLRPSLNSRSLAANALLSDKEWREIDQVVVPAAKQRLSVVQALRNARLIHNVGGWGILESEFEAISLMSDADVTLSGVAEGEEDLPDRRVDIIPIPVVSKTFRIEGRMLAASRMRGEGLDVTGAMAASYAVAVGLEDLVLNGATVSIGGQSLKGLTNHGSIITGTFSGAWDTTPKNAVDDVLTAIGLAQAQRRYGPFHLAVPTNWAVALESDYVTTTATVTTVRERLMMIDQVKSIGVADRLTSSNAVLVQLTPDAVDLAVAMGVNTVQWEIKGGMVGLFKVMGAMAPRIKVDHDTGKAGIVKIA